MVNSPSIRWLMEAILISLFKSAGLSTGLGWGNAHFTDRMFFLKSDGSKDDWYLYCLEDVPLSTLNLDIWWRYCWWFLLPFSGWYITIKNHPFSDNMCLLFPSIKQAYPSWIQDWFWFFSWLWNVSYRCNKSLWIAAFGICFKRTCHGGLPPFGKRQGRSPLLILGDGHLSRFIGNPFGLMILPSHRGINGSSDPIPHMVWLKFFQWSLELPCKTNFWSGKVSQFFEQQNFWVFRWTQTSLFLGLPGKGTQKFYKKSGWVEDSNQPILSETSTVLLSMYCLIWNRLIPHDFGELCTSHDFLSSPEFHHWTNYWNLEIVTLCTTHIAPHRNDAPAAAHTSP